MVGKAVRELENDADVGFAFEALLELIDQLESKKKKFAKKLDFEKAAKLPDRVRHLR